MKLPATEASSFALGQVLFENKSVNNVKRRGALMYLWNVNWNWGTETFARI